jgi:hypothetical protein
VRCPSCGARNAGSADWCTQCYTPLGAGPDPHGTAAAAPETAPAPAAAERPPVAAGATRTAADAAPTAADPRFRQGPDGVDWRCEVCDTWNPLDQDTCASCGQPFHRTIAPEDEAPSAREVDPTVAVAASLVLPGAGHVLLGRTAQGVLRGGLYVLWLGGGLLLVRAAAGSGQGVLPAMPLLLGAFVVLVASVAEVQQTASGHELTVLRPRATLWLIVAVVGLLMLSFLGAVASAS